MSSVSKKIEKYCEKVSLSENKLLEDLSKKTWQDEEIPQMLSGPLVGGILHFLVKIAKVKNVLEVGMFTGYSTLKIAEALPDDGEVHSCELMEKHVKTATNWFNKSDVGYKIKVYQGQAITTLESFQIGSFDMLFIDADKIHYPEYYKIGIALLKTGGIGVLDNMLWNADVLEPKSDNAKALRETAELIKNNDRLEPLLLPVRDGIMIFRKK